MAEERLQKWKKCPSCKGFIPRGWSRHEKCGWKDEQQTTLDTEIKESKEKSFAKTCQFCDHGHTVI